MNGQMNQGGHPGGPGGMGGPGAPGGLEGAGMPATTWNAQTLPADEAINDYAYSLAVAGQWILSKGAMIAYYGNITFHALSQFASREAWLAARFSSPLYSSEFVIAEGNGTLVIGDRGMNIDKYVIEDGNLTVKAVNLLGLTPSLSLKQSIIPGFVSLVGSGTFLASSNGPVIVVEPPFRADPDALLGWANCAAPSVHYDHHWMAQSFLAGAQAAFGRESGEERQYDIPASEGGMVLLQSSESLRVDSALVRLVEQQTNLLDANSAASLGHRLIQRAQQN